MLRYYGKLHSGNLLFKQTDCTYQVIRDLALSRMIVILRPFRIIHFIQRNKFPIPKTRRTYSRHIPDEANGTGSDRSQVRTGHCRIAIIFIKKDTIPSYVMDITITQSTFFRSLKTTVPPRYIVQSERSRGSYCSIKVRIVCVSLTLESLCSSPAR